MAWPTTVVSTGELVTASQLNLLPIRIGEVALTSSNALIEFQSIPNIYSHLILVGSFRSSAAVTSEAALLRFNNDSSALYQRTYWYARGTGTLDSEELTQTRVPFGNAVGSTAPANVFSAAHITIPNYTVSTRFKSLHGDFTERRSTATLGTYAGMVGGEWRSTAAIDRITLSLSTGSFIAGSTFSLYGWA